MTLLKLSVAMRPMMSCFLMAGMMWGCGAGASGPVRYDLSGKATYDSKPIPYGTIQFVPDEKQGNPGPAAYAEIVNGEYSTKGGGLGVIGGPHVIRITGKSGRPEERQDSDAKMPNQNLFPEYTTTFDLPKENGTLNLDVPKGAK